MKKFLKIISVTLCVAIFVMLFSSCNLFLHGGDFVLMADRYSIQPTGTDFPELFFYDKDGNEIKNTASITVYVDGEKVKRRRVTLTEEKTVSVYAEYNGMRSNTIFVTGEFASNLPIIIIDTDGKQVSQYRETEGTFYLYDRDFKGITDYGANATPSVVSDCTVKIRGQSSALIYDKKQYKIHLQNEDGSNNNISLLGMPKENDWIINGTYGDTTVMHNYLVYSLAAQMDFGWAPRVRYCEAYVTKDKDNLKDDEYLGLFVLMESIKIDENRVNVTKGNKNSNPEDIGYIFAKDKGVDNSNSINTRYDTYKLEAPSADNISASQKKYLRDKIQAFEDVLYSNNFKDEQTGYRAYFDADSYIDAILLTELTKNIDGIRLSTYFKMDTDGIIRYGAVWDYDISCGTCDYGMSSHLPLYFVCLDPNYRYAKDNVYQWLDRMMEDEWFRNRLVERYRELRETVFAEENIQGIIDAAYYEALEGATRNGKRWPALYNGSKVWPNKYMFDSYTEAVNDLKTWLHKRVAWLDENIGWVNGEKQSYGNPTDYNRYL